MYQPLFVAEWLNKPENNASIADFLNQKNVDRDRPFDMLRSWCSDRRVANSQQFLYNKENSKPSTPISIAISLFQQIAFLYEEDEDVR